jgi:hypothetical protein
MEPMTWTEAVEAAKRGEPVLLEYALYQPEDLVHPVRLTSAALPEVAASLPATPVNWNHHPTVGDSFWQGSAIPVQGAVRDAQTDDEGRLYGLLYVDGAEALQHYARGIRLRASIEATPYYDAASCSVCGERWFAADSACSHQPGRMYGGRMCYIDIPRAVGDGVALTTAPASRNTGPTAQYSAGRVLGLDYAEWMEPARLRAAQGSRTMGILNRKWQRVALAEDPPAAESEPAAEGGDTARLDRLEQAMGQMAAAVESIAADVASLRETVDAMGESDAEPEEDATEEPEAPEEAEPMAASAQGPGYSAADVAAVQALMARGAVEDGKAAARLRAQYGAEVFDAIYATAASRPERTPRQLSSAQATPTLLSLGAAGTRDTDGEVAAAKRVQRDTGCDYTTALRLVRGEQI